MEERMKRSYMIRLLHSIHDWFYKKFPKHIPERKILKTHRKIIRAEELLEISFMVIGTETNVNKLVDYLKGLVDDISISEGFWFVDFFSYRIHLGNSTKLPLDIWLLIAPSLIRKAEELHVQIDNPEYRFSEALIVNSFQPVGAVTGKVYESS